MMYTRAELKERAKQTMDRQYWRMMIVSIVFFILVGKTTSWDPSILLDFKQLMTTIFLINEFIVILIAFITTIAIFTFRFLISNPILVGVYAYHIQATKQQANFSMIGYAFKNNYLNIVKIMALRDIKTLLWSILFIIPGIIKQYEYAMVPYLLAENSTISKEEAFHETKQMMTGEKLNLFILELSFIGWYLLCAITCGIGLLFLMPYLLSTYTHFYLSLKHKSLSDWV